MIAKPLIAKPLIARPLIARVVLRVLVRVVAMMRPFPARGGAGPIRPSAPIIADLA